MVCASEAVSPVDEAVHRLETGILTRENKSQDGCCTARAALEYDKQKRNGEYVQVYESTVRYV